MPRNMLIQVRRGTAAQWAAADAASAQDDSRLLAAGEPGYDTTNAVYKIGDGSSTWADLPGFLDAAALDARYVPVLGLSPTGTAAGDQAAMTAVFAQAAALGAARIYFNPGTYHPTGPMPPIGRTVAVSGAGSSLVTIAPTAALGTHSLFRVTAPTFEAQQASSFGGITIDGSATTNACGLEWGDVNGGILDDLVIQNFKGTAVTQPGGTDPTALGRGLWLHNSRTDLGITERLHLGYVRFFKNTVNVLLSVDPGLPAANGSFMYQRWQHVQMSLGAGQIGIWLKNGFIRSASLNVMANQGSDATGDSWFLYLDGSGADHSARLLDTELTLQTEADGAAGTAYGLYADASTMLTGHGTFLTLDTGSGATVLNHSGGATDLMGRINLPGIYTPGPINGWNVVATSADYTASPWDLVRASGALTVTMPANARPGQKVMVTREGAATVTIAANAGQVIHGMTSVSLASSSLVANASVVLVAVATNSWRIEASQGTDLGVGEVIGGPLQAKGGLMLPFTDVSGNATFGAATGIINITGGTDFTVGPAVGAGQTLILINSSAAPATIHPSGGGTINGAGSYSLPAGGRCLVVVKTSGATNTLFTVP